MNENAKRIIDCPICGSKDSQELYADTLGNRMPQFGYDFGPSHRLSFRTVRCSNCGHGYSSPLPPDIYANYVDVEDEAYMRNRESRLLTAQKVLAVIRNVRPAGRLLDIGCATGDFLSVAMKYYVSEGLELSTWAANVASKIGVTIHRDRLFKISGRDQYDVVTLWGVIEHFENPGQEIAEINRLLKTGGLLCLWTAQ